VWVLPAIYLGSKKKAHGGKLKNTTGKPKTKIVLLMSLLSLFLAALLLLGPRQQESGHYDFEELSPAVARYPNFYALMIEPNNFNIGLEEATLSAVSDLADKLHFENFILLHQEAVRFNPAAFKLWASAFNLRGQEVVINTAPDRSGSQLGYFVMAFLYNEASQASNYALQSSQLPTDAREFSVLATKKQYRHAWQVPSTMSANLKAQARLRLVHDEELNESINMVTFQNDESRRWPFLLAIDTSRQEALAHGFPYFIVLEASMSGAEQLVAMQVRTRYLRNSDLPDDLYERGYRAFMIWQSSE
jgi:hypothetical protein